MLAPAGVAREEYVLLWRTHHDWTTHQSYCVVSHHDAASLCTVPIQHVWSNPHAHTNPAHTHCSWPPLTLLILNLASLAHTRTHHRDYWVRHRLGTVVPPIVVSIMFVYCLVEFLATAFADPGIIPRSHRNHKHAYRRPRPPRVQVTDCAPPPLAAATSHFWYGSLQFGAHRLRWCRVCVWVCRVLCIVPAAVCCGKRAPCGAAVL